MNAKDFQDMIDHPEWFESVPLLGHNKIHNGIPIYDYSNIVNPPVMIRRKPIPFVFPIKGSAL